MVGDAGDLLRHGASPWQLWAFGLASITAGLALWHWLGPHFGLGHDARAINQRDAVAVPLVLLAVIVIELLLSHR